MSRLDELLSKELRRGRDDVELDELARLLDAYRREPVADWEPCEIDGRAAHRRALECGHVEIALGSKPRGGIVGMPDGTEIEMPLGAVCHACYRNRGDA